MIVNQYSFVFVVVVLLSGAIIWAHQSGWALGRVLMVCAVLLATVLVLILTHREASSGAVPELLSEGKVVLVEYYSDY